MVDQHPVLFDEQDVAFHRMETFHRERVQAFAKGSSPLKEFSDGILVIHMIPESCVLKRRRLDVTQLKEHGSKVYALGSRGAHSRFNVDGLMNYEGYESVRAYSQIYRDGRLEAAMSDATYPMERNLTKAVLALRDSIVEQALFALVPSYLEFCKSMDLEAPVWLFSALVGCEGTRICTDWGFRDVAEHGIDRTRCHLPEFDIMSLEADPKILLRPWCDTLWQACGMERSFNFDQDGNWRERRR